jgi:fatty acid omega-hydroxylase
MGALQPAVAICRQPTQLRRSTSNYRVAVPKDVKQAVRDDTLPDGTFIPQGSLVAYLPHAMGRLETLWGPDAHDFKPSRFLSEKYSPFKFIAFNAGPRTCLGQQLALVEASIVLSLLYRNYRVTVVPGQHITSLESLTLPMRSGIKAVISRR